MAQDLHRPAVHPRSVEGPAAAGGIQIRLVESLWEEKGLKRSRGFVTKTPARIEPAFVFSEKAQTFLRSRKAIAATPKPNKASVEGSGTGTRKPRISPPPTVVEWMFQY